MILFMAQITLSTKQINKKVFCKWKKVVAVKRCLVASGLGSQQSFLFSITILSVETIHVHISPSVANCHLKKIFKPNMSPCGDTVSDKNKTTIYLLTDPPVFSNTWLSILQPISINLNSNYVSIRPAL